MRREIVAFLLLAALIMIALLMHMGLLPSQPVDAVTGQIEPADPVEAILGLLFAIVAFLLPRAAPVSGLDRPVRIWRRGVAFYIDMNTGIVIVVSAMWFVTKTIAFIFPEAASPEFYDLVVLAALASYFWAHSKMGRPTIGQYIMGYRIENDPDADAAPRHLLGMFAALFAACSWHIWGWFVKYEDTLKGNYWWDRAGRTRAVFVGPY